MEDFDLAMKSVKKNYYGQLTILQRITNLRSYNTFQASLAIM